MDIEKPTEQQLKQALAKMLPEKITHTLKADPNNLFWIPAKNADRHWKLVLDTELLHLCLLVEETLNPAADKEMESNTPNVWRDYVTRLDADCYKNGGHSCVHATWQQRTTALAKVLGVEIV
jgi:hypothetical protein